MPVILLRVLTGFAARAWRVPTVVMLVAAGVGWVLIATFEPRGSAIRRPLNFLWYFFVSGTTVGYGDMFPLTGGGRIGAVIIISSGLTAGLMLFAQLTVWMARGKTMKANGLAQLHHYGHVVIIGYHRTLVRQIIKQLRPDPRFKKTSIVVIFWGDQLTGENPDPDEYDVVRYTETAFERAQLKHAQTVLVNARSDDETVRVMLSVNAYYRRHDNSAVHLVAGLEDMRRQEEICEALNLINPDIEPVDGEEAAVIADVIRNPGVAAIHTNLSRLETDSSLFRVDIPADAGEWSRLALGIHLLRQGCTLLAVGDSHRPNARFRLAPESGEIVRGGQALAVVARERPTLVWHEIPADADRAETPDGSLPH